MNQTFFILCEGLAGRLSSTVEPEGHGDSMFNQTCPALNLNAAWIGILLGCLSGAAQGLYFHRQEWLGGYGSWPRRMLRLGHISFFGIALLNLAFVGTVMFLGGCAGVSPASWLFIGGAVGMPLFCYLSAVWTPFRHGFAIPVVCLTAAVLLVIRRLS
jgi:hypothetical protein